MIRLLVCGGRDFDDQAEMDELLDAIHAETPVGVLINGGQASRDPDDHERVWGADWQAAVWAGKRRILIDYFYANWFGEGKAAGPIRNTRMLKLGKPDMVAAVKGGRGTHDMMQKAAEDGVPLRRIGKGWVAGRAG